MTTEEIFQKYAHTNPPMTVRSIIEYAYKQGIEDERERIYDMTRELATQRDRVLKLDIFLRLIGK